MKCKNCGIELVKHWQAFAGKPVFTWYHKKETNCINLKPEKVIEDE